MKSNGGRIAQIAIGVIALLVGATFAGQGLNLIPGSVMTGDRTWFWIGLVLVIGGAVMLVFGLRRRGGN